MSIVHWFLFVLGLLLVVVSLRVDFALLFLFVFGKIRLSIACVFVSVVVFVGLEYIFQNRL